MLKTWEEGKAEARSEGRAEGLAEGRLEGRLEGLTEGRARGRTEGRVEGQANDVLTVLRARGIAVTDELRKRILAEKDHAQLNRSLEKAAVGSSIEDVIER